MTDDATSLARFLEAIDYPDLPPPGARACTLAVDGYDLTATVTEGRLSLELVLARDDGAPAPLAQLAGYAAGRLLKEEATLAWDPAREAAILWQEIPATAEAPLLRRFFEVFATSCDWWRARLGEASVAERIPEMVILP